MSLVVQCDHCEQNNSSDPIHGLHTMFQINVNQMFQSQVTYSPQLCDSCAIDLSNWVAAKIVR
jgi:hypothetical protein